MKIQKFLVGGSPSFLVIANPFAAPAEDSSTTSSKSSGKKDGLLSESLLNKLYEKGIPVDVDNFVLKLAQYELQEQWGLGVSTAAIRGLEAQANKIIQQALYLNRAENFAERNSSLGEIAVGSRGLLYVQGENGELKTIGMSEYDPEKHGYALTVGDLIELRKFNPDKAYDTDLTLTINNNLGMQKINEYIQGIIKTVGDSSTTSEAYTDLASYVGKEFAKRPTEELLKNLLNLAGALLQLGPDAIFKNKEIIKSRNMQEAFEYIRSVLPRDMRIQLSGRWVANGGSIDSSGKYMDSIIAQALTSANSTEYGNYLDFDASVNKAAGTKAGKDTYSNLTGLEQLINGDLGQKDYTIVSKSNPDLALTLKGSGMEKLTNTKNELINMSILSDALDQGLGALIDRNHMYYGDDKIDIYDLDKIVYEGQTVLNVWVPVDANGNPDFGLLNRYEEVKQKAQNNKNLTQEDIHQMLLSIGLDGTLDSRGNYVGSDPQMQRFILLEGITSNKAWNGISNNDLSYKISGNDKKDVFSRIKRVYSDANKGKKGNSKRDFPKGWFDWSTDLYAAPIFLKVSSSAGIDAGTIVGNGAKVPQMTLEQLMQKDLTIKLLKNTSDLL